VIKKGLLEKVLKVINAQLEAKDLKVKGVCGAILAIVSPSVKPFFSF